MFIYRLVKEYRKQFGFKNVLSRNIKANKWILLYLFFSISFPIIISILFYQKELLYMGIGIVTYVIALYIGGEQHKERMAKAIPVNTLGFDVQPFKKMLSDKFSIETEEQLIRLDELIRRELYLKETNRKYPFSDVVKQLFVAIFTTGLLSYAFLEIREGQQEVASNLIAIYIICLAAIVMLGGFVKQIKDFGSSSSLNDISYLIQLALLEDSMQNTKHDINVLTRSVGLPSRKNRRG